MELPTKHFDPKAARTGWIFALLAILLVAMFALSLVLGSVWIPVGEVIGALRGQGSNELWVAIVCDFRLPRAYTAVLAGAALSVSGLQMQTIFRNPLAGPYVLGISSGSSLGVAIMLLGLGSLGATTTSTLGASISLAGAAWVGALALLLVILAVSVRVKDIMTILILGMMFGSAATALVSVLQLFSNESMLRMFVIWTMGSMGSVTGTQLGVLAVATAVGLGLSLLSVRMLNVLLLGESYSKTLGVNITMARMLVFTSTSILAGSVTAFCGPIGFIGIAMPHVARMVFRTANHAVLLPGTLLLGSIVMLLCDTIAQVPGVDIILPINSVTALIGVPIVIYVVLSNRRFVGV